ncbi:hypothetical protein BP00DRAFT_41743 [Aspergillus indologenus CBS 114.80]|uniref:Uncharacterized protein n=1 Tax=Aspergillus indologenus CBS 114.80 TaxID=1450541 RepID=A0A2V5ID20_9EURO|nr:hypothetical protein BP00DRAFT_41743 [Aspergillus indologenus CBS 114.80]
MANLTNWLLAGNPGIAALAARVTAMVITGKKRNDSKAQSFPGSHRKHQCLGSRYGWKWEWSVFQGSLALKTLHGKGDLRLLMTSNENEKQCMKFSTVSCIKSIPGYSFPAHSSLHVRFCGTRS